MPAASFSRTAARILVLDTVLKAFTPIAVMTSWSAALHRAVAGHTDGGHTKGVSLAGARWRRAPADWILVWGKRWGLKLGLCSRALLLSSAFSWFRGQDFSDKKFYLIVPWSTPVNHQVSSWKSIKGHPVFLQHCLLLTLLTNFFCFPK